VQQTHSGAGDQHEPGRTASTDDSPTSCSTSWSPPARLPRRPAAGGLR
jgi:hypothetical protein